MDKNVVGAPKTMKSMWVYGNYVDYVHYINELQLKIVILICDWACKNQPCERKLHRVIFSLISSALIEVFCFREVQREAHEILQW